MRRSFLLLPILALLLSCGDTTEAPPDNSSQLIDSLLAERHGLVTPLASPPTSDTLISLNRTICYGFCPAYGVVVTGSGDVFYNGHRHVQTSGRAQARVPVESVRALVAAVNDAGFMTIDSTLDCTHSQSDGPTALFYVRINGVQKQLSYYHGCMGFPEKDALLRLERAIDSLSGVEVWTGK